MKKVTSDLAIHSHLAEVQADEQEQEITKSKHGFSTSTSLIPMLSKERTRGYVWIETLTRYTHFRCR